jgi:hypothetical protein
MCPGRPKTLMMQDLHGGPRMNRSRPTTTRHYALVLTEDGLESTRRIEFEALGPDSALFRAEKECRGREAELFEDGRSLGRIKCALNGGYWVLTPAGAVKSAA